MKKLITIILIALLWACDVDGTLTGSSDSNTDTGFIEQNLKGLHSGESWEFVSGYAEEDYFDATNYSFELYNISPNDELQSTDPWAYLNLDYLNVKFSAPKEVGVYNLHFDFNSDDNFTATFYNPNGSINTIATSGTIEITVIDETAKTITGRMNIWYGDKSEFNINGNFTVPYI